MKLSGIFALLAGLVLIAATPAQVARFNNAKQLAGTNPQAAIAEFQSLCNEGLREACSAVSILKGGSNDPQKIAMLNGKLAQARAHINSKNYEAALPLLREICASGLSPGSCTTAKQIEEGLSNNNLKARVKALVNSRQYEEAIALSRQPCHKGVYGFCGEFLTALDMKTSAILKVDAPGGERIGGQVPWCYLDKPPASCAPLLSRVISMWETECAPMPTYDRQGCQMNVDYFKSARQYALNWRAPSNPSPGTTARSSSPATAAVRPAAIPATGSARTTTASAVDPTRGPPIPTTSSAGATTTKRVGKVQIADASKCLSVDKSPGIFGAFRNSCDYRVVYTMCVVDPKPEDWSWSFRCIPGEKPKHLDFVGPNGVQADHNRGGKGVHWFACRYSIGKGATNFDMVSGSVRYHLGEGLKGECYLEARNPA